MSIVLNPNRFGDSINRKLFSGARVRTAKVTTGISNFEDFEPEDTVNITLGVFFDGTLNNRLNAQSGNAVRSKSKGESHDHSVLDHFIADSGEDTSYYNDESNVSKLEPNYKESQDKKNIIHRIYIDGIGTEEYDTDSSIGYGLGQGPTGIKKKVEIGCEMASEHIINAVKNSTKKKVNITIDSFGFSRGAAAARHFVFEQFRSKGDVKAVLGAGQSVVIIKYNADGGILGEILSDKSIEVISLRIRFVGLFDTVTSLGLPWFHKMNDKSLKLDVIKRAKKVVQLTADDEHRSNFSLTNINASVNSGVGTQIELPGVHSDIGGGYIDGAGEKIKLNTSHLWLPPLIRERQFLIDTGWYLEDEITVDRTWGTLWGTRDSISSKYSFIPLHMMCEFGRKEGEVNFMKNKLENKYRITTSDILTLTKMRLYDYAFHGADKMTFEKDESLLKILRNKYFHFSAHFNGLMDNMAPNFEKGVRKRKVYNG